MKNNFCDTLMELKGLGKTQDKWKCPKCGEIIFLPHGEAPPDIHITRDLRSLNKVKK